MRSTTFVGVACAALALVLVAGCGQHADGSGGIPPERKSAWESAFNAGDAAKVASLYAEDATLVIAGAEPVQGREAIGKMLHDLVGAGAKVELQTLKSVASGGVGYVYGSYVMRGADSQEMDRGYFAEIWERRNGEWYITVDANATSVPPPAPAPDGAPPPADGAPASPAQ